jgi:hypothetical protein
LASVHLGERLRPAVALRPARGFAINPHYLAADAGLTEFGAKTPNGPAARFMHP